MVSVKRMRFLKNASIVFSLLLLAAFAIALSPWSAQHASAQIITATCADNGTDSATLNAAITGSHAGDQIIISGQCLLTAPITLLGNRSYMGGSRTGTVLQQANSANLPYLLASDSYVSNSSTTGLPFTIHQLTVTATAVITIC